MCEGLVTCFDIRMLSSIALKVSSFCCIKAAKIYGNPFICGQYSEAVGSICNTVATSTGEGHLRK